jgi:xanthine/uracil permease
MVVVMIESTGMFLALGEMTGRKVDQAAIARGLRADGVGTILAESSTPSPTRHSRRMSALSASPACARDG